MPLQHGGVQISAQAEQGDIFLSSDPIVDEIENLLLVLCDKCSSIVLQYIGFLSEPGTSVPFEPKTVAY